MARGPVCGMDLEALLVIVALLAFLRKTGTANTAVGLSRHRSAQCQRQSCYHEGHYKR